MRLLDSIGQCPSCGAENFFDPADGARVCWSCRELLGDPLRLVFDDMVLVLREDGRVHAHHVRQNYDLRSVVAVVTRHPEHPERWGLHNVSDVEWTVTLPTGRVLTVRPDRAVGLVAGGRYDLGGRVAVLKTGPDDPAPAPDGRRRGPARRWRA